jgi:hypothetical protein
MNRTPIMFWFVVMLALAASPAIALQEDTSYSPYAESGSEMCFAVPGPDEFAVCSRAMDDCMLRSMREKRGDGLAACEATVGKKLGLR